ncbi:hypothetical protein [Geminocystis sp. GBBB08]|uniref:hypothetical protein n=1 Tax=Geminocystis sp. GBBB08 TaxID=2604140 RepID=UPI0027E37CE7|nr:hypothetical protein [Geminocystis sp. GBBB08]MBL1210851.1 hypothetical protein [Geminocystis sp. GBBB08]
MKKTHYLTTKIQKGNRLDLHIPELPEGQNVEIIIIVPENQTINDRENNLTQLSNSESNIIKKSLAQRRQLMEQQAEAMEKYYEEDQSWRDWVNLDLEEIYEY